VNAKNQINIDTIFSFSRRDAKIMMENMRCAISNALGGRPSPLKMFPSYIDIPDGSETGEFLSIDLGGTNLRVLSITLLGNGRFKIVKSKEVPIPFAVIKSTDASLFTFAAKALKEFIDSENISTNSTRKLGFTFSFPFEQNGISSGTLIKWTKGFMADCLIGMDVVQLLKKEMNSIGMSNIDVCALSNDTTSTLMAGAYRDQKCAMGIVLGTGTNACYRQRTNEIKNRGTFDISHTVINMEWGNFDAFPRNRYDRILDKASSNQGEQLMEKAVSGAYIGELARITISDLHKQKVINNAPPAHISAETVSSIYSNDKTDITTTKGILENAEMMVSSESDIKMIQTLCRAIIQRSSKIAATATASVMRWMLNNEKSDTSIAVTGGLYKSDGFRNEFESELYRLLKRRVDIINIKDASGIGGAISAATAVKS